MKNLKESILKQINEGKLNELNELKEILSEANNEIILAINKKIDSAKFENKKCVVCGKDIDEVEEPFVLYFGKRGFRKRAFFCGTDCLIFFLNNYRNIKLNRQKRLEKIYF